MKKGEIALEDLAKGYRTFLSRADRDLYSRLCSGQSPHTLVIGCSDSRVVPEEIFSAKPGDLFVLRNVGNLCCIDNPSVASAIEYAVEHLHVGRILVLSHSDCGAVMAARDPAHLDGAIRTWLCNEECNGAQLEDAIKSWGICQLERVKSHPLVKKACEDGRLDLTLAFFDLASLRLELYSDEGWHAVPRS
ncbi:MAG TPA: carbonic anhydrase [Synergistales bacterium]|jgi:carbonic anhydrase|nr:carbonic anhydrase [Synergistales bacterium]MDI9391831.1 carbonic anhydrase [Synergistota bacterium]MDY0179031.1 carbonic anhydrase [Synergistaceae bacterium]HRW86871.1 carbonic anhydrase [Thermovirgaceae bacterium]MDD3829650.1 carbonic anhydrase [Synergistales bacterium]